MAKRTRHRRRAHRRVRRAPKRVSRRRHRRVGAMALNPTSTMVQAGSVVLGYFLAGKVNPLVDKLTGTMDAKIVSAIQVGLGGALVLGKIGGKRSLMTVIPGGVLAGAGLKRALVSFGVVTGYGAMPVVGRTQMNGYQKVPVIGYNPQSSLNGYETASMPINGPNISNKIMGSVNGSGKGSGLTTGSELIG